MIRPGEAPLGRPGPLGDRLTGACRRVRARAPVDGVCERAWLLAPVDVVVTWEPVDGERPWTAE